MGDRYDLFGVKCAYCGVMQKESIWYAPTCSCFTFECEKCKKTNFIQSNFKPIKLEDLELEEVEIAINNASNFMDEEQIGKMAKRVYLDFKRMAKNEKAKTKATAKKKSR